MNQERDPARVHETETRFHDEWARAIRLQDIRVTEAFEAPTAVENRFILHKMGSLDGKRLLDIGAGLGESSVYFASKGARVTAVDISPRMVECATRLAELHGVQVEGVVMAGEKLNVPPNWFDLVYIANTLHHVANKEALWREVYRVLKPGGRFFTADPLAYNPIIKIYRRMATAVRTPDETPLTFRDVRLAKRHFQNVRHHEFWILALTLFLKYYLIDGVHPNADRYWRRILTHSRNSLWWWIPLQRLDLLLARLPLVRRMAWNVVIWGEKGE